MKCKECGMCCSQMILEIGHLDILREPRLAEFAELCDGNGKITFESDLEKEYLLPSPCPFLTVDMQCSIYPTRPNICVAMEAGGVQCCFATAKQILKQIEQDDREIEE